MKKSQPCRAGRRAFGAKGTASSEALMQESLGYLNTKEMSWVRAKGTLRLALGWLALGMLWHAMMEFQIDYLTSENT